MSTEAGRVLRDAAGRADLLATIVAATTRSVAIREAVEPMGALEKRALDRALRAGAFRDALARPGTVNVIAECKRRSPSKGILRRQYDPASIAAGYAAAGAAAISVLTESTFFDGDLAHLELVRQAVSIPVLRKDFVVSEYQLLEARACGADAVLLIVAALNPVVLAKLASRAAALGLDVLVEVHDADELAIAIDSGAKIIGVNNRNLRTLHVDVTASDTLVARIPDGCVAVSESGLKTSEDLTRLRAAGYHAFLIGERFMTEPDPGAALRQLLAAANA